MCSSPACRKKHNTRNGQKKHLLPEPERKAWSREMLKHFSREDKIKVLQSERAEIGRQKAVATRREQKKEN